MFTARQIYLNLIKLHADLSKLEIMLARTGNIDPIVIDNMIGRLKKLNMYGRRSLEFFVDIVPFELLMMQENDLLGDKRRLLNYIRAIRISLEKMLYKIGRKMYDKGREFVMASKFELFYPFKELYPGYQYFEGTKPVLITVSHAIPPLEDPGIKSIAFEIASKTGAHLLVSTVSRVLMDYNRKYARITPFRRLISKLSIIEKKVKLIIDLHSTMLVQENGIEIGFLGGLSARPTVTRLLRETLKKYGIDASLEKKGYFGGDITRYNSLVPMINVVQIEITGNIKSKLRRKIVDALAEYIKTIKI